jgi:microcystin degradation protein MlrC
MSLDLHGIATARMFRNCPAFTALRTYPHVNFDDTGARAARLLLRILDEGLRPVAARVWMPLLVRGDELITETGLYGGFLKRAAAIEQEPGVLSAGVFIGNPFTDVPELGCQAVVVTDGDPELAGRKALELADGFFDQRAAM